MPVSEQVIIHGGRSLATASSGSSLSSLGFVDDGIVVLERRITSSGNPGSQSSGGTENPMSMNPDGSSKNPGLLLDMLSQESDPARLPPPVRSAVEARDISALQEALRKLHTDQIKAREEEERFMRLAAEDPLNIEVQKKLEEIIRAKNVAENFQNAMEHNPEAFGSVSMLYVDMEVNGVKQSAFIDSGAQMTIMSKSCAKKCGILRLLDTRFKGTAVGVGKAEILGRVHMAPLLVKGQHIPVSITVLDQEGMDFLFGLDNLKRHQCSIDLQKNVLRFPGLKLELDFLPEHLIPKSELFASKPDSNEDSLKAKQSADAINSPSANDMSTLPASGSHGQARAQEGAAFPEQKIATLMDLGFPREKCIQALHAAGGNEEMAASLLFSL